MLWFFTQILCNIRICVFSNIPLQRFIILANILFVVPDIRLCVDTFTHKTRLVV
jgi:hypothetical protein